MRDKPGTLHSGGASFHTTHWSVVAQALESQPPMAARQALSDFCQAYWPPLYTFVRRRGHSSTDAQDLVQGFFAHLLARDTLSRADRAKGRLRSFLLGAIQNYLADERDRNHTLKRGGGRQIVSMDDQLVAAEAALVTGHKLDDASNYDKVWVATLVHRAWERLEAEFVAEDKAVTLAELRPFLVGGTEVPSQEAVAARLGLSFATLRTVLRRTRQRYRSIVRDEVTCTVIDPTQVDDELRYLYRLLLG